MRLLAPAALAAALLVQAAAAEAVVPGRNGRIAFVAGGQVALVMTVRMTKHTGGDAGFWDDSFRVAVGPDVYPASGGLNELVAGRSTSRGEVLVELPDDTRRAELVLGYYGDRRTVPFEVVPAT